MLHHRVLNTQLQLRSALAAVSIALVPIMSSVHTTAAEPEIDPAAVEFFEKQVRPLLAEHCFACHTADDVNGGLILDTKAGLQKGGDSGAAIVAGDPNRSLLIEAVRYQNRDLQMPPDGALKPAQVNVLEKWISEGAADPRIDVAEDASAVKPTGMSIEDGRDFWSFQPVANPAVPEVQSHAWVKTPIDAFILSRLEAAGLQPAEPADKRTLLRRVTFDLIGLPPTPEEVDAFLADDTPEAFSNVVERLLASPQYGVRWGRHWLDVARYADSNGLDENLAFGNAWRYRDYVIDAFNNDKPFDQFLIEQLAGDLLPNANRETKIATGFLSLGAKVLAEPDREKLEMDTIDEQLDTLGKAFMGLTIGCARCHDHKFDPIQHADYYSLAAFFKSTKTFGDTNTGAIKHWHEYSFASEEELAKLKEIDAEIAKKNSAATTFKNQAIAKLRTDARSQAVEYLMAAAQFDTDMSLNQVARIAEPAGLHPRVLHHCRLHLHYHKDDPLFGTWHEFAAAGDVAAIERHYRPLFAETDVAVAAAKEKDPKFKTLDDPRLERVRQAINDNAGFLAVPAKPEHALDETTLAEYDRLMEEARVLESNAPDELAAMGVADGEVVAELPIHIRGSHRNLGDPVPREFPQVMWHSDVRPIFSSKQSGRLQLANWMASTQHPLTARVYVNRIWRWHFGHGLVRSTENFGVLGDRPSHPELLDWLARHFMETGWSTKELHRLILNSSVYKMSNTNRSRIAATNGSASSIDPENRLLWKFPMQRLEAEEIRDAILAISGRLDESLGGKTVPLRNRQFVFNHTSVDHTKYDSLRRAAYLPVIRNNLYTLFSQFDFPDPTMPTGNRNATVVAPQALLIMNAPLVMDSADQLAEQLMTATLDDEARIAQAYARTLNREPTEAEQQRALEFIAQITSRSLTDAATVDPTEEQRAWSLFCQSLFASNEFMYVR